MEILQYSALPEEFNVDISPSHIDARDMGFQVNRPGRSRMKYEFANLDTMVMSRTWSNGHRYDPEEDLLEGKYIYVVTTDRGYISEMRGQTGLVDGTNQSLLLRPGPIPGVAVPDDSGVFRTITTGIREDRFLETLTDYGFEPEGTLAWKGPVQNTASREGRVWSEQVLRFQNENFDGFGTPGMMLPRDNFQACISEYLTELLVSLMLSEGVVENRQVANVGRAEQIVRTATAYMEHYFRAIVSMKEVADACGVTMRRLQQAFAEVEGTRPHSVLVRVRLNAARNMLREGGSGASVTDIAMACGFTHLGRFSGAFRAAFGASPSSFCAEA